MMIFPMVFYNPVERYIVGIWGDDFAGIGTLTVLLAFESVLLGSLEARRIGFVGPGCVGTVKLLNRTIAWTEKGFEWHTDTKHSTGVCEKLGLKESSTTQATPGSRDAGVGLRDGEDYLTGEEKGLYASCAGSLLYHALDRPDLQFTVGRLMSALTAPCRKHVALLKQVCRYLVTRPGAAWKFYYQEWPSMLTVLADADWAANTETRRSTDCVHIYLGGHLLESTSCSQQLVALSSGESEFYGVIRGAAAGIQIKELLGEMGIIVKLKVLTDSSAARGMVRRSGSGRVKHIEARFLWLQEKVRDNYLEVDRIDTSHNTADLGTKFHSRATLQSLVAMMPVVYGRLEPGGLPLSLLRGLSVAALVTAVEGQKYTNDFEEDSGGSSLPFVVFSVALFLGGLLFGCYFRRQRPKQVSCGVQVGGEQRERLARLFTENMLKDVTNQSLRRLALFLGKDPGRGASKEALIDAIMLTGRVREDNVHEMLMEALR